MGLPLSFGETTHCGHQFSIQHETRHCLGKSATYVARIGKIRRTKPSAQVISTPSLLTFTIRNRIFDMQ